MKIFKSISKILWLLMLTAIVATGCKKETEKGEQAEEPQYFIKAKVNGNWIEGNHALAAITNNLTRLTIEKGLTSDPWEMYAKIFAYTAPGTYHVDASNKGDISFAYLENPQGSPFYANGHNQTHGTITVAIDSKVVTGSFSFKAYNMQTGEYVDVTEGSFKAFKPDPDQ